MRPLWRKRASHLHFNDRCSQEVYALLDEDKFEKIINNLLYNAIKFNKPGGWVRVEVRLPEAGTMSWFPSPIPAWGSVRRTSLLYSTVSTRAPVK